METGAKTEHGRPDQNTNARKLSERKGSGGTVQGDMKTVELATKKHGPSGKIERRSTVRLAKQVWVQRAAHSKRVAREKPIPKNRKVKSGGHARVPAGRTKKTPKYVREYRPYGPTQRKKPEAYSGVSIGHTALREKSRRRTVVRILRRIKIKTDEGKTKRTAHPRRSKGRRRKYYDGRSTARPARNAKIRGGAAG